MAVRARRRVWRTWRGRALRAEARLIRWQDPAILRAEAPDVAAQIAAEVAADAEATRTNLANLQESLVYKTIHLNSLRGRLRVLFLGARALA